MKINQLVFYRICDKLLKLDSAPCDTNVHKMLEKDFPEVVNKSASALMVETLEEMFKSAFALTGTHFGKIEVTTFMSCFRLIWESITAGQPRREEFRQALQPHMNFLSELFYTEDLSVIRFENGLFGMFDYGKKTGCFRGKTLEEKALSTIIDKYTSFADSFHRYRILDDAKMTISEKEIESIKESFNKQVSVGYNTSDVVWGVVFSILFTGSPETAMIPLRYQETQPHDNIDPSSSKFAEQFGILDYKTLLKVLVFYSLTEKEISAARFHYELKEFFTIQGDMLLMNNWIEIKRNIGEELRIKDVSDLKLLGSFPSSNGQKWINLNKEYHRVEWEEADKIRKQEEKAAKIEIWWRSHPEEKEALDQEEEECRKSINSLSKRLDEYYQKMRSIENESCEGLAAEVKQVSEEISNLVNSTSFISLLSRKKRRECQKKADQLKSRRKYLETRLKEEESTLELRKAQKKQEITAAYKPIMDERQRLEIRLANILAEKTKERS